MNLFSLKKQVIVITGSCGLIGREVCDALVYAGANLVLIDKVNENIIFKQAKILSKKHKTKILFFNVDIVDEKKIKNSISSILKKFKKIDTLINLAAIDAKINNQNFHNFSFTKFPIDQLELSLDVNVKGTFIVTKNILNQMLKQKNGNIINVASTYSIVAPNQNLYKDKKNRQIFIKPIDYVLSKSVIPNFTRYIATSFGKKGIRANTIVPHGVIEGKVNRDFKSNFSKMSPLGRFCKKEELRGPFIFMSSNSSSYMNGSTLIIDGGWTAW